MKRITLFLFLLAVVSFGVAMAKPRIECPGKRCNPAPLLDETWGGYLYAVTIEGKVPVLSAMSSHKKSTMIGELGFGELVQVYQVARDGSHDYMLVGVENEPGRHSGWVRASQLTRNRDAMKTNRVYRKIVAVNNISEGIVDEDLAFLCSPWDTAQVRTRSDLFRIWYVFAESPFCDPNGTAGPVGDCYYLVGESQQWNPEDFDGEGQRALAGWISAEQTLTWNSRLAFSYLKDNFGARERALFFCDAPSLFRRKSSFDLDSLVAIEPNSSDPPEPWAMRFPILDCQTALVRGEEMEGCQVGVPGRVWLDGETTISGDELRRIEQGINAAYQGTREVDILILVDHSLSMRDSNRAVSEAVREFTDMAESWLKANVRFSFATYRDYPEGDDAFRRRVKFEEGWAGSLTYFHQELEEAGRTAGDRRDRDFPEAVFNGVAEAVRNAQWRSPHSNRYLVVLGEHGDRPEDINGWTDRNGDPSDQLIETLIEADVTMFGLQVPATPNENPRASEAYAEFSRQFRYLADELNRREVPAAFVPAGGVEATDTLRQVRDSLSRVADKVRKDIQLLDRLAAGSTVQEAADSVQGVEETDKSLQRVLYTPAMVQQVLRRLAEHGLTLELLQENGRYVEAVQRAWVSEFDRSGQQQLEIVVLIDRSQLTSVKSILYGITTTPTERCKVSKVAIGAIKAVTGDSIGENESLSDYFDKVFGIPFRSPSMKRSLEELDKLCWDAPEEYMQFQRHLNNSITYLNSVDGEFAVTTKTISKTNGEKRIVVEADESRSDERLHYWWRTRSNREFAWIPLAWFP